MKRALPLIIGLATAATYPFTLQYVAGYLDMTAWANPNTSTNLTTGVVGMFCGLGLILGWGVPKALIRIEYFQKRKVLVSTITLSTTFVAVVILVSILGLAGLPGVKWLE